MMRSAQRLGVERDKSCYAPLGITMNELKLASRPSQHDKRGGGRCRLDADRWMRYPPIYLCLVYILQYIYV